MRSKTVVIDTSALIRLYIPDGPIPENLVESVELAEKGDLEILCPELLSVEFYQVLLKKELKGYLNKQEVDGICDSFNMLPIKYLPHAPFLPDALDISRKNSVTVYDGLFLSLASKSKSSLITADDLMAKVAAKLS